MPLLHLFPRKLLDRDHDLFRVGRRNVSDETVRLLLLLKVAESDRADVYGGNSEHRCLGAHGGRLSNQPSRVGQDMMDVFRRTSKQTIREEFRDQPFRRNHDTTGLFQKFHDAKLVT